MRAVAIMNELITYEPPDFTLLRLGPLLEGKSVIFQVQDMRLVRHTLKRYPVLALTPLDSYVPDSHGELLVALEGKGCWVVRTRPQVKATELTQAGLSMPTARVLAAELNKLYQRGK